MFCGFVLIKIFVKTRIHDRKKHASREVLSCLKTFHL